MINPMDLTGRHILITGASSGIGRAAAIQVSKLGAKVSIVSRNEEKLNETKAMLEGNENYIYPYDLNQIEGIEDLIKQIVSVNGPLDGFVHCAGITNIRPLPMTKPDFLHEMLNINFYAFTEILRTLSKKKNSNDGASFIGISSVASIKGNKTQGAYSASKAAIDGLVHVAAKELAVRAIRVNSIAFGMINTDSYKLFKDSGGSDESLSDQYLGIGEPVDAGNVIAFLLSDAARFITGTTMIADGGFLS